MTLGFSDTAPRKDTAESSLPPREDTNKQHSDRRLIMWSSNQSPVKSHVLDVYILSIYIYLSHDIPIGFMMLHDGSPLLYSTGWFLKIANG
jgi:hypothetical protein